MGAKTKNDIVDRRRDQLREAAYRVVSTKGYTTFTIRDIAKEANLSTGLVHYYFKNKEDLLLSLLSEMNKTLKRNTVDILSRIENPLEKLKTFMRLAFDQVSNEKEYYYVIIDFWAQANRNERMRKANIRLFDSYHEMLTKILEEGAAEKIFSVSDMKYTVTIIISLMQGFIIHYVIDSNSYDYRNYTAKIIEDIIAMVHSPKP
ncbi:MAG TPA: TetR/AcrR family transcriptional regulator [Spirochaetota bacterium]|nr:TetR/AcrR family transcriptional regulator [Spirochaetota bacterium]